LVAGETIVPEKMPVTVIEEEIIAGSNSKTAVCDQSISSCCNDPYYFNCGEIFFGNRKSAAGSWINIFLPWATRRCIIVSCVAGI